MDSNEARQTEKVSRKSTTLKKLSASKKSKGLSVNQSTKQLSDYSLRLLKKQSISVGAGVFISPLEKDLTKKRKYYMDTGTVWDCFKRGLCFSDGHGKFIGVRNKIGYKWLTYNEANIRVSKFGSGLIAMGVTPGQETNIGILMNAREEWNITVLSCYMYSMVNVPIYTSLRLATLAYVIEHTDLKTIVVGSEDDAMMVLNVCEKNVGFVKNLIICDTYTGKLNKIATACSVNLTSFLTVESLGNINPKNMAYPTIHDMATIVYTSGKCGLPKAVVLDHHSMVNVACKFITMLEITDRHLFIDDGVFFCCIDPVHVIGHLSFVAVMMEGLGLAYPSKGVDQWPTDIATCKPIFIVALPTQLVKLYVNIMHKIDNSWWLCRILYRKALSPQFPAFLRKIIFSGIRSRFTGKNLRLIICGGAQCDPKILETLFAALGCDIITSYGMSETNGFLATMLPGDNDFTHGHCILPGFIIKLADVPSLNYIGSNGIGEICCKGSGLFQKYYKDERTDNAFDAGGWFRTGDIGIISRNGKIRVINNFSSMCRMAQGVCVSSEKIQRVYVKYPFLGQLYVYSEPTRSYLVGLLFPHTREFVAKYGDSVTFETYKDLCANADVVAAVLADLIRLGKENLLSAEEIVHAIEIIPSEMNIETGLLTPTDKFIRHGPSVGRHGLFSDLLNYTIGTFYPEIPANFQEKDRPIEFFRQLSRRTAHLVAKWQCLGFCHGVLNTDNMSICGVTIDYGPFGFMERYDSGFICNSSDNGGRYAYSKQPSVCRWNLTMLAAALLLPADLAESALKVEYDVVFQSTYLNLMRSKLGYEKARAEVENLVMSNVLSLEEAKRLTKPSIHPQELHQMIALAKTSPGLLSMMGLNVDQILRDVEIMAEVGRLDEMTSAEKRQRDADSWDAWLKRYAGRLALEAPQARRAASMDSSNPRYILRNHLAQKAISLAEQGDYSEVARLLEVLEEPFTQRAGYERYQTRATLADLELRVT